MRIFNLLNLGAGWQSSRILLGSELGELPTFDATIFADTQWEPVAVYDHLAWMEGYCTRNKITRVSAGNLRDEILGAMQGKNRMDARPPFFTSTGGMLHRQCTQDFKIIPIIRNTRRRPGRSARMASETMTPSSRYSVEAADVASFTFSHW